MLRKIPEFVRGFLADRDLHITSDIFDQRWGSHSRLSDHRLIEVDDNGLFVGEDYRDSDDGCWRGLTIMMALRTEHDPSVGIYGQVVSPWFENLGPLVSYIRNHVADIDRACQ